MILRPSLIVVFLAFAAIVWAQNLIPNGGFEQGDMGWEYGTENGVAGTVKASAKVSKVGKRSLTFTVSQKTTGSIFGAFVRKNGLTLQKGATYQLAFSMMTNDGTEGQAAVTLYSKKNTGGMAWGVVYTDRKLLLQGDGQWQDFEFTFIAKGEAGHPDFDALGLMFGFGLGERTYFLDKVRLEKLTITEKADNLTTYHVAKTGNDSHRGDASHPFLTIGQAAKVAQPGDTVLIGKGTYRETVQPVYSGTAKQPILYRTRAGEKVVISGMEPLNNWSSLGNGHFGAVADWSLGDGNMLMYDGQLCDLARWPNNVDHDFWTLDASQVEDGGNLTTFKAKMPDNDWANSGILWFLGTNRWTSWREDIKAFNALTNEITYQAPTTWEGQKHNPKDGGEFILFGAKDALDYSLEFYYDTKTKTVLLQTPTGQIPESGQVEMKKRTLGLNLTGRKHLIFQGIDFYGCSIRLARASTGNIIRDCKILWGNHSIAEGTAAFVDEQSVELGGKNNLIERCEIAYGAHTGVLVTGTDNVLKNCIIHDFNYMSSYSAPVTLRKGKGSIITQNTIYNGGRDLIQFSNTHSELSYNNLFKSNVTNDDCGPIYVCCGEYHNTIHHNFIHSSQSRAPNYKAAAVYLDNSSKHFSVHHNIIADMEWSAFQINWDGWFLDIYNNTVWNVDNTMKSWLPGDRYLHEVRVVNNLTNNPRLVGTALRNNLVIDSPQPETDEQFEWAYAAKQAVDFGTFVKDLKIPQKGTAPDAGAYEDGLPIFVPGANWLPLESAEFSWAKAITTAASLSASPQLSPEVIRLQLAASQLGTLYIFDQKGQLLKQLDQHKSGQSIDVYDLQTGVYFVYFKTKDQVFGGQFLKISML